MLLETIGTFFVHSYFSKTLLQCFLHAAAKFHICTSRAGQAGGGGFKRGNKYKPKKTLPIECAQGDQPVRCPNRVFCVNEPSAAPWWWCGLFWCHEVGCRVEWSNVVGCEVTSGEVVWLVARCHVMSSDVMMSYHVVWCDVISCVLLRDVMQCDAMWCALMWWAGICCEDVVKWCDALWVCDAM